MAIGGKIAFEKALNLVMIIRKNDQKVLNSVALGSIYFTFPQNSVIKM